MSSLPEYKVRYLVNEIAKDIIEIDDILSHVGITREEYIRLSTTRAFKEILTTAKVEWQGATNTAKRTKLKAAAIAEELLLTVFFAAKSTEEPLNSKTKALEAIAKIGGLGALEPAAGAGGAMGNVFNLQINYSNKDGVTSEGETIQIGSPTIEAEYEIGSGSDDEDEKDEKDEEEKDNSESEFQGAPISSIFSGETFEDL